MIWVYSMLFFFKLYFSYEVLQVLEVQNALMHMLHTVKLK